MTYDELMQLLLLDNVDYRTFDAVSQAVKERDAANEANSQLVTIAKFEAGRVDQLRDALQTIAAGIDPFAIKEHVWIAWQCDKGLSS